MHTCNYLSIESSSIMETFFKKLFNWPTITVISIMTVVIVILSVVIAKINDSRSIIDQNFRAAKDSLRIERLSNGELIASRDSYVAKVKNLEDYIDVTDAELKAIRKNLDDNVAYIGKLETLIEIKDKLLECRDTIVIVDSSTVRAKWSFGDEWYTVKGFTDVKGRESRSTLEKFAVRTPLKVGVSENYRIFVTSPNPYLSITELEGAVLDEDIFLKKRKKQRFTFSLQAGYYVGYDLVDKGVFTGPGAGIGVSFNF